MGLIVSEPVDTAQRLRAILPRWSGNASKKDHDRINDVAAEFIACSPFVIVSSACSGDGHDVSPKGDAPGFVRVYDERTLIIPDRLGNHRLDTFENILEDPRIGLLFLIPGHNETLRVAGTGQIAHDKALRDMFAINQKIPDLVLVVHVDQVFMHCSKSLVRSRLWSPETWRHADKAPSLAKWVKSTVTVDESIDEIQAVHDRDRESRLY